MPVNKLENVLKCSVSDLRKKGTAKGKEFIIEKIIKPQDEKGPRYILKGFENREYIKMNSNSYLGMSLRKEVVEAEEHAVREYGVGPGAVRFISGSHKPHRDLEKKLAEFHGREEAMIFSSAYVTVMGTLATLASPDTVIISDELNHNCIINAVRLSRPKDKTIYKHNDVNDLDEKIKSYVGKASRILVVTDGIFSMRGDYAPLDKISEVIKKYDSKFDENIVLVVDDSHGVGAFGKTGRGTEEYTNCGKVDVLIGTLGKAYGVNGGYITSSETIVTFLRESAPMYIYSNPITTSEAAAVIKVLELLESKQGTEILEHLRNMTKKFEKGLLDLGFEIIVSDHPIVPVLVRNTEKTAELVKFLIDNGVLATGLNYPVVPKGDETIRFQVNADHTAFDIDCVLDILKKYKETH
ncbi:aminotransferase class I/II-fold pyridoxal phosphate-dependent enzyme [candidate division WOR-3 bacterium]|nr:aminotransferase class I/II-fold pyridoxal phosphate-dependent enzyme [candidate division WOR-3 bacterium]